MCVTGFPEYPAGFELQKTLRSGRVRSQGRIKGKQVGLIDPEFWRYAFPVPQQQILNLETNELLEFWEVCAEDLIREFPPVSAPQPTFSSLELMTPQDAAASPLEGSNEDRFVVWMNAERQKHGTYPPRDKAPKRDRKSWGERASEMSVSRDDAKVWVKNHKLNNRRGAPDKSARNNSAEK